MCARQQSIFSVHYYCKFIIFNFFYCEVAEADVYVVHGHEVGDLNTVLFRNAC